MTFAAVAVGVASAAVAAGVSMSNASDTKDANNAALNQQLQGISNAQGTVNNSLNKQNSYMQPYAQSGQAASNKLDQLLGTNATKGLPPPPNLKDYASQGAYNAAFSAWRGTLQQQAQQGVNPNSGGVPAKPVASDFYTKGKPTADGTAQYNKALANFNQIDQAVNEAYGAKYLPPPNKADYTKTVNGRKVVDAKAYDAARDAYKAQTRTGMNIGAAPQKADYMRQVLDKKGKPTGKTELNQADYDADMAAYNTQYDSVKKQIQDNLTTKANDSAATPGGQGSLLTPYGAEQYAQDPMHGAMDTSKETYQKDVGYTAIPTTLAELQATPGYQFREQQGEQAVNNSAAAKGGLLSGGAQKALTDYGQGLASTEYDNAWRRGQDAYSNFFNRTTNAYQNAFNRDNTNKSLSYNMLSGQQGIGLTAVTNQMNNVKDNANTNANLQVGAGAAQSNATIANNAAQVQSNTNVANAAVGALSSVGGAFGSGGFGGSTASTGTGGISGQIQNSITPNLTYAR